MPTQIIQRAAEIYSLSWAEVVSLWRTCHGDKFHNLNLRSWVNEEGKITTTRVGRIQIPMRQLHMPPMEAHLDYLKRSVQSKTSETLRLPIPIGWRDKIRTITQIMATMHLKVRYPTGEKREGRPTHFQNYWKRYVFRMFLNGILIEGSN